METGAVCCQLIGETSETNTPDPSVPANILVALATKEVTFKLANPGLVEAQLTFLVCGHKNTLPKCA